MMRQILILSQRRAWVSKDSDGSPLWRCRPKRGILQESKSNGSDGEVCLSVSGIRITMKGLEYLQENSLMKKAANLAKGIAEIVP